MDEQRPELDMEAVEERAAAGLPVDQDMGSQPGPQKEDPRRVELRELQKRMEDLKLSMDMEDLKLSMDIEKLQEQSEPAKEAAFSPNQISELRAEFRRMWSELRLTPTKRFDTVRDEKAEAVHPSHTAPSQSELVNLAEQIVGSLRELESRLEPVLLGPRDEPTQPEGSPMVSALGQIRLMLDQLIDRINI